MEGTSEPADFQFTNGCGGSLLPGKSCSISITFTPMAKPAVTATLDIFDNARGDLQTVKLTGAGK